MTRLYIQPSWIDSCSDHSEWSGGNDQYRGDKSIEAVPTYINGKPNVKAFSDEAIAARRAKKVPSVPITDRILPQKRRLNTLYEQMQELERSYRSDEMNIKDYTLYRDIIVAKIQRQEVLYKRAASVRPIRPETPEDEGFSYVGSLSTPSDNNGHGQSYSSPVGVSFFAEVIDELSEENSLKGLLKFSCKAIRGLLNFKIKFSKYVEELKSI